MQLTGLRYRLPSCSQHGPNRLEATHNQFIHNQPYLGLKLPEHMFLQLKTLSKGMKAGASLNASRLLLKISRGANSKPVVPGGFASLRALPILFGLVFQTSMALGSDYQLGHTT